MSPSGIATVESAAIIAASILSMGNTKAYLLCVVFGVLNALPTLLDATSLGAEYFLFVSAVNVAIGMVGTWSGTRQGRVVCASALMLVVINLLSFVDFAAQTYWLYDYYSAFTITLEVVQIFALLVFTPIICSFLPCIFASRGAAKGHRLWLAQIQ